MCIIIPNSSVLLTPKFYVTSYKSALLCFHMQETKFRRAYVKLCKTAANVRLRIKQDTIGKVKQAGATSILVAGSQRMLQFQVGHLMALDLYALFFWLLLLEMIRFVRDIPPIPERSSGLLSRAKRASIGLFENPLNRDLTDTCSRLE